MKIGAHRRRGKVPAIQKSSEIFFLAFFSHGSIEFHLLITNIYFLFLADACFWSKNAIYSIDVIFTKNRVFLVIQGFFFFFIFASAETIFFGFRNENWLGIRFWIASEFKVQFVVALHSLLTTMCRGRFCEAISSLNEEDQANCFMPFHSSYYPLSRYGSVFFFFPPLSRKVVFTVLTSKTGWSLFSTLSFFHPTTLKICLYR